MNITILCIALLGLLVVLLGFGVSMARGSSKTNFGVTQDPTDRLYIMSRAHGNAAEYAPMLALMIYLISLSGAATWELWLFGIVVAARYCHAAGMILSKSLDVIHPLRIAGSLGTYVGGLVLGIDLLLKAF
ncbi:MAG: MAPEG family protein [Gammaproteobacteria bacterium]|nr:MAPEG family protein [Gammaproteobacteria bacterium]